MTNFDIDKGKMINFRFIIPQDGEPERIFKQQLLSAFLERKEIQKAYLVQIQYNNLKENSIALCICTSSKNEKETANFISNIFIPMFKEGEHLNIIFLNKMQEKKIKSACPPFFNRDLRVPEHPDFYLASSEGYGLEEPRKCWCVKQLNYGKRDDLILVNINPSIIYRDVEEGDIMLDQIVLAGRHLGYPIFPLKNWPIYVYVARPKVAIHDTYLKLEKDDIQNIAWGELYPTEESAKLKKIA